MFPINDEFNNPISGGVIFMPLDNPGGMVVFDTTFINPTNSLGYMNVRGLNIDKRGNIWASNFGSLDPDKKIIVFDKNEYNKNNLSGTAYYDLEILQTPVLEAFTNNASSMKTKLV